MFERVALVHYHEIGLKGRNRSVFERRLRDNLDAALVGLPVRPAERIASRLAVEVTQSSALDEVVARLAELPGIVSVSSDLPHRPRRGGDGTSSPAGAGRDPRCAHASVSSHAGRTQTSR